MLKKETISLFDREKISIGDVVQYTRLGSGKQPRTALVQQVSPERLTVVFCNLQTGKVSYQVISAKDVNAGIYTLTFWEEKGFMEDTESDLPDLEESLEEDLEEDLDEEDDLEQVPEENSDLEDVDFSVSVED
ncbi:MAG: hypothetical protein R3Y63_08995 [Eubacteriales bacterium]